MTDYRSTENLHDYIRIRHITDIMEEIHINADKYDDGIASENAEVYIQAAYDLDACVEHLRYLLYHYGMVHDSGGWFHKDRFDATFTSVALCTGEKELVQVLDCTDLDCRVCGASVGEACK